MNELEIYDMIEELENDYNRVEYLVSILKERTTGGVASNYEYKKLRQYFKTKNYWSNMPDILIKNSTLDMVWGKIQPMIQTYKERRLFIDSEFFEILEYLEDSNNNIIDINDIEINAVNVEYVNRTWEKAISRIQNDPEGAITSARTLLETVLKCLAEHLSINIDNSDLKKMYKEVSKKLNLSPDQHSEQAFKMILQGCISCVGGLASLRNSHGDCHGKGNKFYKPDKRHARLAVNLAGGMAMFLIETYEFNLKK